MKPFLGSVSAVDSVNRPIVPVVAGMGASPEDSPCLSLSLSCLGVAAGAAAGVPLVALGAAEAETAGAAAALAVALLLAELLESSEAPAGLEYPACTKSAPRTRRNPARRINRIVPSRATPIVSNDSKAYARNKNCVQITPANWAS